MTDLEKAKSVFFEGKEIRNYFENYGKTIEEYKKIRESPTCDKYHNEFNYDGRFSACSPHKVFFSSAKGYYGDSSCSQILSIRNEDIFWKGFDKFINLHKEEIFDFIASYYEEKAKEMKDKIIAERDNLNEILKVLE